MALTETTEYDKIEIVSEHKAVQVRKALVVKRDGVEIARTFTRFALDPGELDGSNNLVDNPLDKEPDGVTPITDEVKVICNAAWTTSVKDKWKEKLIAENNQVGVGTA